MAGITSTDIAPGAWVALSHPLLPVSGEVLISNAELEPASETVTFTTVSAVGDVPVITLVSSSELFEQSGTVLFEQAGENLYTITAFDAADNPVPGALITLGSETLRADAQGQATFQIEAGTYTYVVEFPDGTEQTNTITLRTS